MAAQQTSAPPAQGSPGPGAAGADPAQGQGTGGDAARLDRLEATQREQGAVLDKVLAAVTGGASGAHAAPAQGQQQQQGGTMPDAAGIAAQVRREITEADQRRKAEEDDKTWRDGVTEALEKVKAEKAPREPETGFRARLQRLVVGKDPS